MNINKCVKIFNAMLVNKSIPIEDLFNLISDYLTENNIDNSGEIMKLIIQNPQLIEETIPTILDYCVRKYDICSIIFNNKTILYYVTVKNN